MTTKSSCPTPQPCDPQTFKVCASSTYPRSELNWEIDLPLLEHMYYQNITYDLMAVLIARIGVEFSRFAIDGDDGRINEVLDEVRLAIKGDASPIG
jgi:hypothetical protein